MSRNDGEREKIEETKDSKKKNIEFGRNDIKGNPIIMTGMNINSGHGGRLMNAWAKTKKK